MKTAALATALILAASAAQADPWRADGITAVYATGGGLAVGIIIDPEARCDVGNLVVAGNRDITVIGLAVDGTTFGHAEATYISDEIAVVDTKDNALRAIKTGSTAIVLTDQGSVIVPLAGSAAAINLAYANCMAQLNEAAEQILRPLKPSAPVAPTGGVRF